MRLSARLLGVLERRLRWLPDELYLVIRFRRKLGRWPNLREPRSFNEHLLKYKLATKGDARLPRLTDKIAVKAHIAAVIGPEHAVPTLWCGTKLPPRDQRRWTKPYVIKSNHACGQIILVRSEAEEDWDEVERVTSRWLSSHYRVGRRDGEWQYAEIEPQLLVEPMLCDGDAPPPDIKLYVFGGGVHFITVDEARFADHCRYTFDRDWRPMAFEAGQKRGSVNPARPSNVAEMIALAEKLGREFEFVRVDFYATAGELFVGEMTFFPGGGHVRWDPPEGDYILGKFWRSV